MRQGRDTADKVRYRMIHAVIADDEVLARQKLRQLLKGIPDVELWASVRPLRRPSNWRDSRIHNSSFWTFAYLIRAVSMCWSACLLIQVKRFLMSSL